MEMLSELCESAHANKHQIDKESEREERRRASNLYFTRDMKSSINSILELYRHALEQLGNICQILDTCGSPKTATITESVSFYKKNLGELLERYGSVGRPPEDDDDEDPEF